MFERMKAWLKGPKGPGSATETTPAATGPESAVDVVAHLEAALRREGYAVERHGDRLVVEGFVIDTWLHDVDERSNAVRTATETAVSSPLFGAGPIREFQHAFADDVTSSIGSGYERWARIDFVVLLDALRDEPSHCMSMVAEFPADGTRGPLRRRILFGPVEQMTMKAAAEAPACDVDGERGHDFCPCCLFTQSHAAFDEILRSDALFGIRLLASRGADGTFSADCRVNGEEHAPGIESLLAYAATWPDAGFDMRKQYVVVQTLT